MEDFVSLDQAIKNHDLVLLTQLCEEKPSRMSHPELIPALHMLCRDCHNGEFFKEAWTYLVSKGCDPFERPYKKNMNPLEYLILKNPAFFDNEQFPHLPMEQAFWWLYYNFYNDPMYLPPDDRENHIIHFAYKYSAVLPSYYEQIQDPPVALFKYIAKDHWFDYVPSPNLYQLYRDMFKLTDISEITYLLTGSRAPSFKNFIDENFKSFNFELLGYIRSACSLDIKHEEKMEILNYYAVHGPNEAFTQHVPRVSPYENILHQISFKRFFRIFIENSYMNRDTLEMVEKLRQYNIPIDFRDFDTARALHDYCSRELNRYEAAIMLQRVEENARKRNKEFESWSQTFVKELEIIQPLQGKKSFDFELYIPSDMLDVFAWGRSLKICIGSTFYIEKVCKGELKIIFIKKDGKEYGCCTVSPDTFGILEIKGPCNTMIDPEARRFLVDECVFLKNEIEKIRPEDVTLPT